MEHSKHYEDTDRNQPIERHGDHQGLVFTPAQEQAKPSDELDFDAAMLKKITGAYAARFQIPCGYGCNEVVDEVLALIGRAAPERSGESGGDYVLAPRHRGYAALGTGQYLLNHSREGQPASLVISVATDAEKAGRTIGDERDNAPTALLQPEAMAVRIDFTSVAGLDALENQLRKLRAAHFPAASSSAAPSEPDWADSKTGETELWKNPLYSLQERLQMADGAVRFRNDVITNLRAALAAPAPTVESVGVAVPDGWKLVPIEPTCEMRSACPCHEYSDDIDDDWAAMLAAAPIATARELTDADIERLFRAAKSRWSTLFGPVVAFEEFARAIERHLAATLTKG